MNCNTKLQITLTIITIQKWNFILKYQTHRNLIIGFKKSRKNVVIGLARVNIIMGYKKVSQS
jgi:hypothetical protein